MKPNDQLRGHFDGAWWPRSTEPSDEFPALARMMEGHVAGPVTRIAYELGAWLPVATTRKVTVDGTTIRLEGFLKRFGNTVIVSGKNHERVRLLVIPPGTSGSDAQEITRDLLIGRPEATARDLLPEDSMPASTGQLANPARSSR